MTAHESDKKLCFIDSNIWLYAFIESQALDKSVAARSVIKNSDVVVSTQVINEVCVNLIRKAMFPEDRIRDLVGSFYNKYRVIEFRKEIIHNASEIRSHHTFSFWDSLILSSAMYSDAEILYSEDMHGGFSIEATKFVNAFK